MSSSMFIKIPIIILLCHSVAIASTVFETSQLKSIDSDETMMLELLTKEKRRLEIKREEEEKKQEFLKMQEELRELKELRKSLTDSYQQEQQIAIAKKRAEDERILKIKAKRTKAKKIKEEKRRLALEEAKKNRIVAKIDLSEQQMRVYKGKKKLYNWYVSTARSGYMTPKGSYKPYYLHKMHYSKKYHNSPMPHSIFFKGGYAIHGTKSIGRLGRRASHGCVRLHPDNAKKLYTLVQKYGKRNTFIEIID